MSDNLKRSDLDEKTKEVLKEALEAGELSSEQLEESAGGTVGANVPGETEMCATACLVTRMT